MKQLALIPALILLIPTLAQAQAGTGRDQVQKVFTERSPLSPLKAQQERLKWPDSLLSREGADYDINKQSFRVYVPKRYKKSRKKYGLLVWISPDFRGYIPPIWEKKMNQYRVIGVGANGSGNESLTCKRIGLALDAVHNMKKRYRIDDKRVYISGFSGGGRVSTFLAFHYPDVFQGAICVGGCDFYKNVPAPGGRMWRGVIAEPGAELLKLAKTRSRIVFLVGKDDPVVPQMKAVYKLLGEHGFVYRKYLDVARLGHGVPLGKWFEKSLKFLDKPPKPKPSGN